MNRKSGTIIPINSRSRATLGKKLRDHFRLMCDHAGPSTALRWLNGRSARELDAYYRAWDDELTAVGERPMFGPDNWTAREQAAWRFLLEQDRAEVIVMNRFSNERC